MQKLSFFQGLFDEFSSRQEVEELTRAKAG